MRDSKGTIVSTVKKIPNKFATFVPCANDIALGNIILEGGFRKEAERCAVPFH